jgi:hypothetical protein
MKKIIQNIKKIFAKKEYDYMALLLPCIKEVSDKLDNFFENELKASKSNLQITKSLLSGRFMPPESVVTIRNISLEKEILNALSLEFCAELNFLLKII